MKIKYTSLAILSAIILTACGGGGGNSSADNTDNTGNTGNNNSNTTTWSAFLPYPYKENSQAPLKTIVEHQQTTFFDGKGYFKTVSGLDLNYMDLSGEPPLVAVTNDNLYKSGTTHPIYGEYLANYQIQNLSPDQQIWIQQPLSATSKPTTLEHTITWKVIDLSHKKVTEYMDQFSSDITLPDIATDISLWNGTVKNPYNLTYNEFYEKVKDKVFPAGSKCLQLQRVENNQEYFYLNTYPINSPLQKDLESRWGRVASDSTYNFNDLQGMQGYLQNISNILIGYTLIQGRHYEISRYGKVEFVRGNTMTGNDCQDLNDIAASVILEELK